jgi:hypothetical protein
VSRALYELRPLKIAGDFVLIWRETSGGSKFRQKHVKVVGEKNTVQWNRREERGNGIRCVKQNGQIRIENKEKEN